MRFKIDENNRYPGMVGETRTGLLTKSACYVLQRPEAGDRFRRIGEVSCRARLLPEWQAESTFHSRSTKETFRDNGMKFKAQKKHFENSAFRGS